MGEKRALKNQNEVLISVKLEDEIGLMFNKLFSLSNDGKFCVIGGGDNKFYYIIALDTKEQFKLIPQNLSWAIAPCFIDGESTLVAVGGYDGEGVEIWSVADKKLVHHINDSQEDKTRVDAMYSANGILAVGYGGGTNTQRYLQLYDVSSWSKLYRYEFKMRPYSLFLTR